VGGGGVGTDVKWNPVSLPQRTFPSQGEEDYMSPHNPGAASKLIGSISGKKYLKGAMKDAGVTVIQPTTALELQQHFTDRDRRAILRELKVQIQRKRALLAASQEKLTPTATRVSTPILKNDISTLRKVASAVANFK
jgi:hypothetical protein